MESSKQGMWKGYHLSIEGIRKRYLFGEQMVYKRVRGWTSQLSVLTCVKYPHPPRVLYKVLERFRARWHEWLAQRGARLVPVPPTELNTAIKYPTLPNLSLFLSPYGGSSRHKGARVIRNHNRGSNGITIVNKKKRTETEERKEAPGVKVIWASSYPNPWWCGHPLLMLRLGSQGMLFGVGIEHARANSRKHNTITLSQQMFYY